MLKLVWRPRALEDFEAVITYIADRDVVAAARLQTAIEACAEHLPDHPHLYRPGRVPGTREAVVHPNYILVYRVTDVTIEIMALVHARLAYP